MKYLKILMHVIGGLLLSVNSILAAEEPQFELLEKHEDIEIRQYSAYLIAEVIVSSDFEDAGNEAFSSLFGYIGGENISQESIEMTAPVRQEKLEDEGLEIEMTSPVRQERVDSGSYRVSFVMPDRFTLESLPKPKDNRIQLLEVPGKKVAVIRYSGTWSKDNYQENESLLYAFLREKGIQIKGDPVWARYNAPFVPWFLRRNEILIEIE